MPYGSWVNDLPTSFFLVVHIAAFAIGASFAWLAFKRELPLLGAAFSLFGAAELVYMTYHLDWTVFLFAHTVAEVLDLAAFVLVFAGAVFAVAGRPAFAGSRG
jgi:membrane protein implicated in regulation of membrane protease activity